MSVLKTVPAVKVEKTATTDYRLRQMVASSAGGVVSLTPAFAAEIVDNLNFEGQRPIRSWRVEKHLYRILNGLWHPSFSITLVLFADGSLWLIDGQHRCKAIAEQRSTVKVVVRLVPVESEDEARRLYVGFDEADSKRTVGESLDAVGSAKKMELPLHFVTSIYSALPTIANDMEPLSGSAAVAKNPALFSMDRRLEDIGGWAVEARRYWVVVNKAKGIIRKKMCGAGCIAAALYTLKHQPERAMEFWTAIATDDGLRKGDPRKALLSDMTERTLSHGSIRQSVQAPSLAWNAWNQGRDLKIIKCISGSPITFWGTPLAKRAS